MKELAYTLLPDLPTDLNWVYGVFYIIEAIFLFGLLFSPIIMIIKPIRRKY